MRAREVDVAEVGCLGYIVSMETNSYFATDFGIVSVIYVGYLLRGVPVLDQTREFVFDRLLEEWRAGINVQNPPHEFTEQDAEVGRRWAARTTFPDPIDYSDP